MRGATVYLEWEDGGETRHREGTTNADGIAGPYTVPRVTVFVQVTTSDEAWERYGGEHELKAKRQTVRIELKRTKRQRQLDGVDRSATSRRSPVLDDRGGPRRTAGVSILRTEPA